LRNAVRTPTFVWNWLLLMLVVMASGCRSGGAPRGGPRAAVEKRFWLSDLGFYLSCGLFAAGMVPGCRRA